MPAVQVRRRSRCHAIATTRCGSFDSIGSATMRQDQIPAERLAQLGDVHLERRPGGVGR
jgi:hypothetical protein